MMIRQVVLLLVVPAACARPHAYQAVQVVVPADSAAVVVTTDQAWFYFPRGAPRRFLPTRTDSAEGYPNQGFIWGVSWDDQSWGLPHGIYVGSGLSVVERTDTLTAIVAAANASRMYRSDVGDLPASSLSAEPAVKVLAQDGRVVLVVIDQKGLARLWPRGMPDSLSIWWRGPGRQLEGRRLSVRRVPG